MNAIRSALAVALPLTFLAAAPALAQGVGTSASTSASVARATGNGGRTSTGTMQTTKGLNQPAPVGTIAGVPVVVTSPLDAPYNAAAAYSTYEGQPGFGPNAVLAAGDAGAP